MVRETVSVPKKEYDALVEEIDRVTAWSRADLEDKVITAACALVSAHRREVGGG